LRGNVARPNKFLCLKVVNIGLMIKANMNDEPTQNLSGPRSFEERVFARFDSVDARFDSVDARFDSVDARLEKLESRAYDTKPIWERALAQIMETGLEIGEIKKKVEVIETKVALIETDVAEVKTEVAGMKVGYAGIRNELTDVRRELRHDIKQKLELILKFLLEDREDIRDAEDKIRQLETKLA
jgi:chromosome segregation ATPase